MARRPRGEGGATRPSAKAHRERAALVPREHLADRLRDALGAPEIRLRGAARVGVPRLLHPRPTPRRGCARRGPRALADRKMWQPVEGGGSLSPDPATIDRPAGKNLVERLRAMTDPHHMSSFFFRALGTGWRFYPRLDLAVGGWRALSRDVDSRHLLRCSHRRRPDSLILRYSVPRARRRSSSLSSTCIVIYRILLHAHAAPLSP